MSRRDLRRRQGLVDAKSRLVQAKANLFDRNFGDAAKELGISLATAERLWSFARAWLFREMKKKTI